MSVLALVFDRVGQGKPFNVEVSEYRDAGTSPSALGDSTRDPKPIDSVPNRFIYDGWVYALGECVNGVQTARPDTSMACMSENLIEIEPVNSEKVYRFNVARDKKLVIDNFALEFVGVK